MSLATSHRVLTLPLATVLLVAIGAGAALGQEESPQAYVSDVNAGAVTGIVSIEGAVVAPGDDEGDYWFSDGTDVTSIDIDMSASDAEVPLLTLMNIVGTATSDGIEVSSWAPLDLMTAAVVRTPEEAKQAFWAWIIVQNSQAPSE
ncbi:MAG: hypothetical protein ACC726_04295 [Chloroflexota bacterium]